MPIQHAVLALLADRPSYGYELRTEFKDAVGPQWGDLNIGHLYQVLERLVRDGFVKRKVVPQTRRPDRNVFSITKPGREELDRWLTTPFVRQAGYRDDFFLKLVAAARLGCERLASVTAIQRQAYLEELSTLGRLRTDNRGNPVVRLLIDAAVFHTQANLRVLDRAEGMQNELVTAAKSAGREAEPAPAEVRRMKRSSARSA